MKRSAVTCSFSQHMPKELLSTRPHTFEIVIYLLVIRLSVIVFCHFVTGQSRRSVSTGSHQVVPQV